MQANGTINAPGGGFTLGGYRELRVPAELRPFMEVAWVFEASARAEAGAGERHRILPETGVSVCLVHRRLQPGRDPGVPELFVMGPIREPRVFEPDPGTRMDAVRLKPEWCRGFLGIDPGEHADGFDPAPKALLERMSSTSAPRAPDRPSGITTLLRSLGTLWENGRTARDAVLAHQALEAIRASPTAPSECRARARSLGVSDRHLRRLVRGFSGSGMKEFHRVRRLQHAASLATEHRNPHWARLALGAGYSDQAHLVREFRDLVGVTPVELREERRRLAEAASSIG